LPVAYIALGSNSAFHRLDPAALLNAAKVSLAEAGRVLASSSNYSTEPVGIADQPAFLNAVIALETELAPQPLLETLLAIERLYGRDRSMMFRNGPRTLDLDLLLYDHLILETNALVLPHPRLAERRFVLAPLVEIAPTLLHPVLGVTMQHLLTLLPQTGENGAEAVQRVS
jgi:2-amino-4-hydroxy-6-hydroxymethyldihydropteridine diphosphokinase